jgi:hypothetical protein
MADMGKKTSKYSTDFSFMQSVASTGLKHKDPNALLHSMPLPQKYKEEMGPDPKMMQKLQKEQAKKEAAAKKLLKEQPELKDKEAMKESKRLEELANEISQLPTQIYQDDQGRIRDKEGKIVTLPVVRL